ncbi:hypothetical protein [Agrococcus carbonis]|uniref:Uncharacterized protein n=1 Tax=Agrococcus carbonis TaxID=684552 RepID=A0A1H1LAR6_9MICO|nr:hypothetical protein [Agrococcus carbonis]SDR71125.1 hypothetical protein SAMN04489719_0488 [Agrococcus carbonis]
MSRPLPRIRASRPAHRALVAPVLGGVLAALVLAGCATAGSGGDPVAPDAPSAAALDLPMPSADSPVLAIATVLESRDATLLCVGPVAESAPPQCSGPALVGWDWDAYPHEETGGVRWVQGVAIEGTYDAEAHAFTPTGEPMSAAAITMPAVEVPEGDLSEERIQEICDRLMAMGREDLFSAWGDRGTAVVQVLYDDGSMQEALDAAYGEGAVFVISAMR